MPSFFRILLRDTVRFGSDIDAKEGGSVKYDKELADADPKADDPKPPAGRGLPGVRFMATERQSRFELFCDATVLLSAGDLTCCVKILILRGRFGERGAFSTMLTTS